MLYGTPVAEDDVKSLIDLLDRAGRSVDLMLAGRLEHAITTNAELLALSPIERTAMLAVLDDPPDGLAGCCGALVSDHRDRTL